MLISCASCESVWWARAPFATKKCKRCANYLVHVEWPFEPKNVQEYSVSALNLLVLYRKHEMLPTPALISFGVGHFQEYHALLDMHHPEYEENLHRLVRDFGSLVVTSVDANNYTPSINVHWITVDELDIEIKKQLCIKVGV